MKWYRKDGTLIGDTFKDDGETLNVEVISEFERLKSDREYAVVGFEEIGDYVVSTVWLGLDHNQAFHGPPLIFETMVFTKDRWEGRDSLLEEDGFTRRYSTEEEAREGHEEVVAEVMSRE